ncbi:Retinitis pigmentosa 1-like 1 protein Retinitis pigmentosa 1-like protein 1 [Larimichthys crocea]|uniref:Retinitis pigmentosa 1-like 1 protein Retinitis pigmentosa 1-like protein 1 n=1 Tax=Larimichthys crocea TaxID=215358 RepID=A0A6G0HHY9_LARCR|nr:Retinitis pigmentosa 1-like 1 protein Retinitis pigmentosa 1-like protein 1 [Larimichthys crocea]
MEDRAPSATSGKSHASAKSSKSQKSNCTAASPNPNKTGVPSIETNGGEKPNEARVASAMSVKSNKSNSGKNLKPVSPSPNVTIKTPEGVDKEGQTLSPRRTLSPRTHSPKAPAVSPRSPHSAQQLSPGPNVGETRGPSALSVHSRTSAKSSRSNCHCGAASAKKDKEVEDKEEGEKEDNKETSERAASALSSSTTKQRRESGGSEQPLSRNSSGSVSLGLPEDQETADSDSGKSSFNYPINAESKGPKSTERSAMEENVEGTRSQKSNHNGSKSTLSHNPPAVDIPTIETPGQSEDKGEDGGEQKTVRASSALSAKSSRSHKSCCNCSVKAAGQLLDTTANNMNASDNRTSSALSSASAKIHSKSPASASVKKTTGDSANNEHQAVSRPASKSKGKDVAGNKAASVHSKSPCRLKPKTSNSQKKESSSPCSEHSSRPNSKVESCTESILSHSLSAADLLKETMAAGRPQSRQSKASETSDKPKSEKSGRSQKSRNQAEREELTPACLPNASPNEVVSDWLRSIPTDSTTLALGDEEKTMEEKPEEEAAKESPEDEAEEEEDKEEEVECDAAEEEKSSDPAPGDAEGTSPHPNTQPLLSRESLPRNWHSSVAVMKVLLSSSPGRCRSMPEVSPVYGRRLSTSARGFLDCLAQLQLIEPVVSPSCDQQKNCNQRYEDIMAILQSLWLTEPRDIDVSKEQVTPPRSSSGVGMSSGSGGSGKENENQGGDETTQNKTNEEESLHEDEEAGKVVEEDGEGNAEVGDKETEVEPDETSTEQTKTIDEEPAQEPVQSEEQSTVPPSLDSPKATENPSSSEAIDSSKSPTDNERETLEGSSSGTPPTVLRASLSRKVSQDPDPVWVLHLLKKIEKQFMNHYINAMAEFKVRWDLDDSLILNTMISELRDEVSRRIQSSIQREMRKIQSRAGKLGKSPRPPQGENLSRESTMTEKRRRMLKVMKNQSVKTGDSLSDGEMTGDCSDQRSDDEYCPCDACVRKKMAARPLRTNPPAAEAPVVMEFDLLKILQLKKSPSPAAVPPPARRKMIAWWLDEEGRNLEVVEEEEEEETKEDIKGDVLEETIPEEAEEKEDVGEAGEGEEVEEEKEENSIGDEKQVNGGEEAGEDEISGNGEAEEAQCQCQCGGNEGEEVEEETAEGEEAEETSNNTGENETADDEEKAGEEEGKSAEDEGETGGNEGETETGEEESDKETVKEATTGEEGETTEHSEGEEKEGEAEELKPEEEEEETTTGKESGEEEASGETEDDSAAKNSTNDESTSPAEEFVEGNVSASAEAEDEDDGDDGTREGEESGEQEKRHRGGRSLTPGTGGDRRRGGRCRRVRL